MNEIIKDFIICNNDILISIFLSILCFCLFVTLIMIANSVNNETYQFRRIIKEIEFLINHRVNDLKKYLEKYIGFCINDEEVEKITIDPIFLKSFVKYRKSAGPKVIYKNGNYLITKSSFFFVCCEVLNISSAGIFSFLIWFILRNIQDVFLNSKLFLFTFYSLPISLILYLIPLHTINSFICAKKISKQ